MDAKLSQNTTKIQSCLTELIIFPSLRHTKQRSLLIPDELCYLLPHFLSKCYLSGDISSYFNHVIDVGKDGFQQL